LTTALGLADAAALARLLGDPTRLRLLALLGEETLTVAELTAATGLAQSRVSTHLARLREQGLVTPRRVGTRSVQALTPSGSGGVLWDALRSSLGDALLAEDRERLLRHRSRTDGTWADGVAGRMARHYAPGRTWESAARALAGVGRLGRLLDIASGDGALAELLAPRADEVTCLDLSSAVVRAGRQRLPGLRFLRGDMHALPFADGSFDHVLLLNALSYAADPAQAVGEAARVLAPGGTLVSVALRTHRHAELAARYDHVRMGFEPDELADLFESHGLELDLCAVTSREKRPPHLSVITIYAQRPGDARAA
jgi:SAM-dependent methyltransferase